MNPNENLNDVNEILESINRVLSRGVKDRHSDYHTFSVATSDANLVNNRTVVLREFNHASDEKQQVKRRFYPVVYIPVTKSFIDQIHIQITDGTFKPISTITRRRLRGG